MKFNILHILLALVIMTSAAFAQTQNSSKPYKFFEFGKISNKLLKEKVEAFNKELVKVRMNKARGYIVQNRKSSEIIKIEKQIFAAFPHNCGYDGEYCGRITFVHSGNEKKDVTEFWIVPEGAELPEVAGVNKAN